jgi:hypothetical protein
MQKACELNPSTMAAILGLDDAVAEKICQQVHDETGEIVVPANYNCPGQLVISGSIKGVEIACIKMKEAGAKRALVLPVGGAFHSPFMMPAKEELARAIEETKFNSPACPVYQNVVAKGVTKPAEIKENLIEQLTGAVRWAQCVQAMIADGATSFTEVGPGKVLQGLVTKIDKSAVVVKDEYLGDTGVEEGGVFKDVFDLEFLKKDVFPFKYKGLSNPWLTKLNFLNLPEVVGVTVNEVSTRKQRIEQLQAKYSAVTESMEGAPLHYIGLQTSTPFLQVRAISNVVGERDKSKWQVQQALNNLSNTIVRIIENQSIVLTKI